MNSILKRNSINISLILLIIILFSSFIYSSVFWLDNNWESRINISINSSLINEELYDFPVFIKLNSTKINFSKTINDGFDIRFKSSNGEELSFERLRHNSSNEKAEYFVKIPYISDTSDTYFFIYYNNSGSTINYENKTDVWTNNFSAVWHLNEELWNGTAGEIIDSTINSNNGRSFNGANTIEAGPICRIGDFDGNNDYVLFSHDSSLQIDNQITINVLLYLENYNSNGFMGVVTKGGWDINTGYEILIRRQGAAVSNRLHWGSSDSRLTSSNVFPLNQWVYVTATLSGTSARLYLNGQLDNTGTLNSLNDNTRNINVGRRDPGNNLVEYFNGQIGEVRISTIQRSSGWNLADFHSINNTLLNYGNSDKLILPKFYNSTTYPNLIFNSGEVEFRIQINNTNSTVFLEIENTNITANNIASNIYSVIHNFTSTGIYNYTWYAYGNQTNYETLGQSQILNYTVIFISPPITAFVSPTPNIGTTLTLFNQIINITISKSSNYNVSKINSINFSKNNITHNVYDNNLRYMANLNNNSMVGENNTNVLDFSLYNNTGFFQGDTTFSSFGRHGGSAFFDGINDWIQIPDSPALDGMSQFTFKAWIYDSSTDSNPRGIAAKRVSTSTTGYAWSVFRWNNRYLYFDIGSTGDRHSSGVAIPSNEWIHITVTFNGSAPSAQRKKFYYNGELVATTTSSQTTIPRRVGVPMTIGILNPSYGASWNGYIDNVRIWNKTLTEDEIKFMFNSSLDRINSTNWNLEYNAQFEIGENNFSICATDMLGQENCTNRNVTIGDGAQINLISPANNSKLITENLANFTWYINSSHSQFNCTILINNIASNTYNCNSNENISYFTTIGPGQYNWSVFIDNTIINYTSNTYYFTNIQAYHKKVSKRIRTENTNMLIINSIVENLLNTTSQSVLLDYVSNKFSAGSFTPTPNITQDISGPHYNGRIYGWNFILNSEQSLNFNYSVSGLGANYSLSNSYIIGLK